jgi:hypothetical protein
MRNSPAPAGANPNAAPELRTLAIPTTWSMIGTSLPNGICALTIALVTRSARKTAIAAAANRMRGVFSFV